MSVERRILPLPPRRRAPVAPSKTLFSLPLILSATTTSFEEEDDRLSFDHCGYWTETTNRKIRSSDGAIETVEVTPQPQKQFTSVGVQHDGPQLPPSSRTHNVGKSHTGSQPSYLADLFTGKGSYSFDFEDVSLGGAMAPAKPSYSNSETQTPSDSMSGVHVPQWTYSKKTVRFVNRSRRKYMKEKKKVVRKNVKSSEDEPWICPFCDYEDIYNEPPYALITKYEMDEKEEWRRSTLHKKKRAHSDPELRGLGVTVKTFPASYYEWKSEPPDRHY